LQQRTTGYLLLKVSLGPVKHLLELVANRRRDLVHVVTIRFAGLSDHDAPLIVEGISMRPGTERPANAVPSVGKNDADRMTMTIPNILSEFQDNSPPWLFFGDASQASLVFYNIRNQTGCDSKYLQTFKQ